MGYVQCVSLYGKLQQPLLKYNHRVAKTSGTGVHPRPAICSGVARSHACQRQDLATVTVVHRGKYTRNCVYTEVIATRWVYANKSCCNTYHRYVHTYVSIATAFQWHDLIVWQRPRYTGTVTRVLAMMQCGVEGQDLDVGTPWNARHRYIQLAVGEHRFRQVQPGVWVITNLGGKCFLCN